MEVPEDDRDSAVKYSVKRHLNDKKKFKLIHLSSDRRKDVEVRAVIETHEDVERVRWENMPAFIANILESYSVFDQKRHGYECIIHALN